MRVLVTGAAGYIGSHVALALEEAGHEPLLVDDMATGLLGNLRGRPFTKARVHDSAILDDLLKGADAVAHLAGSALVPESVARPEKYWHNNVGGTLALAEAMTRAGVRLMVFSSSCSVYGEPDTNPIREDAPHRPISPYGASKAACERILADMGAAHGMRSVVFRYFNAAGAHGSATIGEEHDPETHLIPLVLQAHAGRRSEIVVHGTDYPVPDGTCVRDYVDVRDIAAAHVMALEAMSAGRLASGTFNLGWGRGHSVREVIRACAEATGTTVRVVDGPRRPGDPPELVADPSRVRAELGWRPAHDLASMVEGAWRFMTRSR